jgi:hypothetical protein
VLGQALDETGRERRFAAARRARHQNVNAIGRQPYRRAVEPCAERDVPAREPRIDRPEVVRDQLVDQLDHAVARYTGRHERRSGPDRIDRIRHRDRTFGEAHERMVVLRIADSDHLVRRHAETAQRGLYPRSFVDAGGQHHDRFPVEDHLQLESELADRFDHLRLLRRMRRDDDPSHLQRLDTTPSQRCDEVLGRRLREQRDIAAVRVVKEGAVLGDDVIEELSALANAQQVVQPASGNEDRAPAGCAQALESAHRRTRDPPARRERVVVIGRQN